MKNITYIQITLILLLSLSFGCQKYDEGGRVCKADTTITQQSWGLDRYFRNGYDETILVLISNLTETYSESGVVVRNYIDIEGESVSNSGEWALNDEFTQITLSGLSSMEWSEENSTISSSHYDIIKLTRDEFWYSYENGGDFHEFHFIPN